MSRHVVFDEGVLVYETGALLVGYGRIPAWKMLSGKEVQQCGSGSVVLSKDIWAARITKNHLRKGYCGMK